MEHVLFDRRQSLCCRDGKIFRKYFKYADKHAVEREGIYSRLYETFGINTPHFIKTDYSTERGLFFNEYYYVNLYPLTEETFDEEPAQKILAMLKVLDAKPTCADGVNFWHRQYRLNLNSALDVLKNFVTVNSDSLLQKVWEQEISVVMHGDFSLDNLGLFDGKIYLYDFASAGCAPKWWDLGYFIASLSPNLGRKLYEPLRNENLSTCIKLAAAVRYGRALRKQEDIKKRRSIFEYWSEESSQLWY